MSKLNALIALLFLAGVVPLAAHASSTTLPWQCSATVNMYDFEPGIARACGDTVYALDHVATRKDGGRDYVYLMNGHQVVIPEPPTNFVPVRASDQQLSYYGFPPRPSDPAQLTSWGETLAKIRPVAPPSFLIQTQYSAPFSARPAGTTSNPGTGATCSPINLCWGGFVNTGTTFTQSYVDYSEPGQVSTPCSGDAVIEWTGLGGYDGGLLGQDGTLTYLSGNAPHTAWWEAWPENRITPMNFSGNQGDDMQSRVYWLSSSGQFKYWVWDTTTGQQQTTYYTPTSHAFDGNSSEFIVGRPQSGSTIYPLRNFWTGWHVTAAQSNGIGMQNFPLSRYNVQNKAGKTLETTSTNSGQSFNAAWNACG